jgi:hypothetical protein
VRAVPDKVVGGSGWFITAEKVTAEIVADLRGLF